MNPEDLPGWNELSANDQEEIRRFVRYLSNKNPCSTEKRDLDLAAAFFQQSTQLTYDRDARHVVYLAALLAQVRKEERERMREVMEMEEEMVEETVWAVTTGVGDSGSESSPEAPRTVTMEPWLEEKYRINAAIAARERVKCWRCNGTGKWEFGKDRSFEPDSKLTCWNCAGTGKGPPLRDGGR